MTENEFKQRLRQAHTSTMLSAQAIVEVLADHEPKYMAVSIGSIEGAATRLETAARQLRDLVAVARAEADQSS